MAIEE